MLNWANWCISRCEYNCYYRGCLMTEAHSSGYPNPSSFQKQWYIVVKTFLKNIYKPSHIKRTLFTRLMRTSETPRHKKKLGKVHVLVEYFVFSSLPVVVVLLLGSSKLKWSSFTKRHDESQAPTHTHTKNRKVVRLNAATGGTRGTSGSRRQLDISVFSSCLSGQAEPKFLQARSFSIWSSAKP